MPSPQKILFFSEELSEHELFKQHINESWAQLFFCQSKLELLKLFRTQSPEIIILSVKAAKTNFEDLVAWAVDKVPTNSTAIFLGNWDVVRLETIHQHKTLQAWPCLEQISLLQLRYYLHTCAFGSESVLEALPAPDSKLQKTSIKTAQDFIDLLSSLWKEYNNQPSVTEEIFRKWVMAFYAEQLKMISRRQITEFEVGSLITPQGIGLIMELDKPPLTREQIIEELKKIQFDKVFLGADGLANFKPGANVWLSLPFYMTGNLLLKESKPYQWQAICFMHRKGEFAKQNVFLVSPHKTAQSTISVTAKPTPTPTPAPSVSPSQVVTQTPTPIPATSPTPTNTASPTSSKEVGLSMDDFNIAPQDNNTNTVTQNTPSPAPGNESESHTTPENPEDPNTENFHQAVLNEVVLLKDKIGSYEKEFSRLSEANQMMANDIKRLMEERKQPTTDEELKAIKVSLEEKLRKALGMVTDFGQQIKRNVLEIKRLQEENDEITKQNKLMKQKINLQGTQPIIIKK